MRRNNHNTIEQFRQQNRIRKAKHILRNWHNAV